MADADRARWNERFLNASPEFEPAAWLKPMRDSLAPARVGAVALDLASGPGRNAVFLAELGYRVAAWDLSDVALGQLAAELARRAANGQALSVEPRRVDLDRAIFGIHAFDLILDAHFLDRALFDGMVRALRPGGLLVIHTFLYVEGGAVTSRLSNPLHALQPGELRRTFGDRMEILDLRENVEAEEAHLLARRAKASTGTVHNAPLGGGGE